MKQFFSKNGIVLLAAVTIVAVLMCVVSAVNNGTGILHDLAGIVASPFRAAGAAVSDWADGVVSRFETVEELQRQNQELRRENARLQEENRQAKIDRAQNARLRNLLNLRQQRRDFTLESAHITQWSSSNWASTLTLGKGTACDIAVGDCVVDEYGYLVGVVTDAGLNWSTVTTLLDTGSQLGALVFRTGETTVAQGDLGLMNRGRLKLSYLEDESSLINGDLIVTSGLGGYYPANLVIGSVEEILTDDSGLTRYAILAPKTDLSSLVEVFVITDFTVVD
jgi:rod shape-determining protein MreC